METTTLTKTQNENHSLKKQIAIKKVTPYLWLFLPLLTLLIFCVYPAVSAVFRSFMYWTPAKTEWVWFNNFIAIFTDRIFWKSCYNMLILVFFGLVTGNVSTLLLAELLFNMKAKGLSKVFRYLFLIPSLVPGMVGILLWKNIILSGSSDGVLNTILAVFNIAPSGWYHSENVSKLSIILTNFPWVGGISFLIYLSGLMSIPESCFEAAELDGITSMKRVLYIDLPLLVSQIKYFFIIGVVSGVQVFDAQLIITDGGPNYSTSVPGYMLFMETYAYSNYGKASAIGVFLFAIAFGATLIANHVTAKSQK